MIFLNFGRYSSKCVRISLPFQSRCVQRVFQSCFSALQYRICFLPVQSKSFPCSNCGTGCSFHQDISDTAAHAGCKVLSGCAEDNDTAAGHILASMLTDTLDNGVSTGVSDTETLSCDTVDVRLTARCAVEATFPTMMFSSGLYFLAFGG